MNKLISILVDNDSWILPYALKLKNLLQDRGYKVSLLTSAQDIPVGWVVFFLGCINIVENYLLDRNDHSLVVHESKLPQGKGFSPVQWQILDGCNEIPILLIDADSNADTGDIWLEDKIVLNGTELEDEWRALQGDKTIEICLKFVDNHNSLSKKSQLGSESFYRRRNPSDSVLDVNKTIIEQFNLLRIVNNKKYPAHFFINNIKYVLTIHKDD